MISKYVRVEPINPQGRPVDAAPVGGIKGRTTDTVNITPYVAESLSDSSIEDMRIGVEVQLRKVADVTRSIAIKIEDSKKDSDSTTGSLKGELDALRVTVSSLSDTITTLSASVTTLETNVATLHSSISTLETHVEGIDIKVAEIDTRVKALEAKP